MWLDGDPKLLAYFFLHMTSGVMCTLLLISFCFTKHIHRYSMHILSQLSGKLTVIPRLGDQNPWWLLSMPYGQQLLNPRISSIGIPDSFLGDRGLSQFQLSVSLCSVDTVRFPYLSHSPGILQTTSLVPRRILWPALPALL